MKGAVATKEETKNNGALAQRREFPLFHSLQQEMNRLFEDFKSFGVTHSGWLEPIADFHAKLDIKDTEKELIVTVELPGVELKDIDISLRNESLVVQGEKRAEKEEKEKGYYRMERSYGSFYRVIPLPYEVDRNSVKATSKDGVVTISLPKTQQAMKTEQKIEVKAG